MKIQSPFFRITYFKDPDFESKPKIIAENKQRAVSTTGIIEEENIKTPTPSKHASLLTFAKRNLKTAFSRNSSQTTNKSCPSEDEALINR